MSEDRALTIHQASHLMPAMQIRDAVHRYQMIQAYVQEAMKDGIHYGAVPGTDKPTLLKPGAEMLTTFFGLTPRFPIIEQVEDWIGENHNGEPFFYYHYNCQLWRGDLLIAEASGSCNSMESKYRWRWVPEEDIPLGYNKDKLKSRTGSISEFAFAVEKAETSGKYGKPAEYWQQFKEAIEHGTAKAIKRQSRTGTEYDAWEISTTVYRVPNEDIYSQVNTINKMAQKRALVAATLLAVNASEFFTQDMEDLDPDVIDGQVVIRPTNGGNGDKKPAPKKQEQKPAPEPEPVEPFEGIPSNNDELWRAINPLGYYDHPLHALNTVNKIRKTKYNTWPVANPEFYAEAHGELVEYANANKAQQVIEATAQQMEAPF